ncbi:MAG: hypothetical protein ACTSPB_24705 [Candidatus Thorarchaeota archaeon]
MVGRVVAPNIRDPCGDGICDLARGENIKTCSEDCETICGDGICLPVENECLEGFRGKQKLCESDCGLCHSELSVGNLFHECLGERLEWCEISGNKVVINTHAEGAKKYGEASFGYRVANTGGETLSDLTAEMFCEPWLDSWIYFNCLSTDILCEPEDYGRVVRELQSGESIPLIIKFESLDLSGSHNCLIKVRSGEPTEVEERDVVIEFI